MYLDVLEIVIDVECFDLLFESSIKTTQLCPCRARSFIRGTKDATLAHISLGRVGRLMAAFPSREAPLWLPCIVVVILKAYEKKTVASTEID